MDVRLELVLILELTFFLDRDIRIEEEGIVREREGEVGKGGSD